MKRVFESNSYLLILTTSFVILRDVFSFNSIKNNNNNHHLSVDHDIPLNIALQYLPGSYTSAYGLLTLEPDYKMEAHISYLNS